MEDDSLIEEYADVLRNLEAAILAADDATEELSDGQVELALEGLIRYYQAEARGHDPRPQRLGEGAQTVFDAVQPVAEAELGRGTMQAIPYIEVEVEDEDIGDLTPEEVSEMVTELINQVMTLRDETLAEEALADEGSADEFLTDEALADEGEMPLTDFIEPVSHDILITCLKRIRKSVRYWNKQGGRRGYLAYVREFLLSPDESE
jgi:hypothetical protein